MHAYAHGTPYAPAICGHEWSGTVSATGAGVSDVREGDRVAIGVGVALLGLRLSLAAVGEIGATALPLVLTTIASALLLVGLVLFLLPGRLMAWTVVRTWERLRGASAQ